MPELPNSQDLVEELNWALDYWRPRNRMIERYRQMVEGKNPIPLPATVQYKAKILRSYALTGLLNEKSSRYLDIPVAQVVVDDPLDPESRAKSTRIERAMATIQYEMERKGDGDVWARVVMDAALLDTGVEKIERAPAAFWKELVESEKQGGTVYPFQSPIREAYKKSQGAPFRSLYVPLESTYPIYDGSNLDHVFEIESRSLYSCNRNELFNKEPLANYPQGRARGIDVQVPIVHYCDDTYYGYYCLAPGTNHDFTQPFRITPETISVTGHMFPLYSYRHGLGKSIYNFVGGRFGGWKTDKNRVEGLGNALLELNQALDEIFSQVFTNIRAKYWGSLVWELDPEQRGFTPGGQAPKPPKVEEGSTITLYKGEKLYPLFNPTNDPTVPWVVDQIREQLSSLGGGGVLFGQRQPGVDTGYHNAQQVSQAEHLDNKLEANLASGVDDRCVLIALHTLEINEPVWTRQALREKGSTSKYVEYSQLDPEDLRPLPQFDSKVRRPKPIDFITAIRAARDAREDQGNKGPILSDDTIHDKILATEYPDIEKKKRIIEAEQNKLLAEGFISRQIMEKVTLNTVPQPQTDNSLAGTDPALSGGIQGVMANSEKSGGINPEILGQLLPRTSGMTPGEPQVEARVGEEISGNMGTP